MIKKISVLILFLTIVNIQYLAAQKVQFHKDFAPQEGLIKDDEKPYRDEICLNGKWQFMPVNLPEGVTLEQIKSPNLPSKSGWEKISVKVPSPWNVNGFTNGEGGDFRTFPSYPKEWEKVKSGWLKKEVKVPADWSGNRIILHFEAVAGYAKVFVNGKEIGDNYDVFLPFNFDVTPYAKVGEKMEILVWVVHGKLLNEPGKYGRRNYVAGSFWGQHIAGIWQDVYLQKIPNVYISDAYIKPWVDKDELQIEVTVKNTTSSAVKFNLDANIKRWINLNGKSTLEIPEINWTLGETALTIQTTKLEIAPNATKVFILSKKVKGALDLWSPESPNLYGLVLSVKNKKATLDKDYTRFGWRQFDIQGTEFTLNGKPFEVRGDSWHFMGIPQMTRRYAYSWYQMLLDANANGLRLHAQVFPRFYIEMADEMGICVLDETAIWSSDGGPKIDSELYWEACREHVKNLVLRDRNYPSVMGWSVCNETLPVAKHVFHAPRELVDRNVDEINKWVAIAREFDITRSWISGDGETQAKTDLPTVIGHYGDENAMKNWSGQGKPWGIGETGMGYYGTPAQIAKVNGDRAYESQLGRMEGLAAEAFDLVTMQRNYNASYASVFNLAWYGVKPLALGLQDITRAPELTDGIFFNDYEEGKPGCQPERLGPYTSTFNPGYDPMLPLYESWPLFDAVKAAYSDNYKELKNIWKQPKDNTVNVKPEDTKQSIVCLSADTSNRLKEKFEDLAVKFDPLFVKQKQLIVVDGANPSAFDSKLLSDLKKAMQKGSTVLFWGATNSSKKIIESLINNNIEFYERDATSYVIKGKHAMLNGASNSSYYFSEITKKPVSTISVGGDWVNESQLLLEACNTDWLKWNYQGEAVKTAKVFRSERESKTDGNIIVRQAIGDGELIVSSLNLFSLDNQAKTLIRNMIENLGGTFQGKVKNIPEALNKDMVLENALFLGSVPNVSGILKNVFSYDPISEEEFTKVSIGTKTNGIYWDVVSANEDGIFDIVKLNARFKENAVAYLSFWLYSPRSLTDLLIEPNMPRLDMHLGMDDVLEFSVNGAVIKKYMIRSKMVEDQYTYEGVPLEKGWNHVLIKVGQATRAWAAKIRFSSTKPEFLSEIKSVVAREE